VIGMDWRNKAGLGGSKAGGAMPDMYGIINIYILVWMKGEGVMLFTVVRKR